MLKKCSTCFQSWSKIVTVERNILPTPAAGAQVHSAGLPAPLPAYVAGTGFATGHLNLGEVEIVLVQSFEEVWRSGKGKSGAAYYKPVGIPQGYFSLGSYAQLNQVPAIGWVLAIKGPTAGDNPPLLFPSDYNLLWSSANWRAKQDVFAYFWAPVVPPGYKTLGYLVTRSDRKPDNEDMVLVREDLTDTCVIDDFLWDTSSDSKAAPFSSWTTKPSTISVQAMGISSNTVYCSASLQAEIDLPVRCLKNVKGVLELMPNLEQINEVITYFGPTVYFHPNDEFLPATPNWFFEKGALLHSKDAPDAPVRVERDGANLPLGGSNDGQFWLSLPEDGSAEEVKKGSLQDAKAFLHVKPMFGGTVTDIATWIFYPFNGPGTAKIGLWKAVSLGRIGEHVCDWEHITLRVDNFTGQLRRVYTAAHSGGTWWRPDELEFVPGSNRVVAYSAKNTHASYPRAGDHLQGDDKIGIGLRNDAAKSTLFLDASSKYEFMAVDHLPPETAGPQGPDAYPVPPPWVDYMREWGPTIVYDSKAEIDKVLKFLPKLVRNSVSGLLAKLPKELSHQEGPTGPKEKHYWYGDERS